MTDRSEASRPEAPQRRMSPALVDIEFDERVSVEQVQTKLAISNASDHTAPMLRIDLSRCVGFDAVALLHVLAFTAARSERRLLTRFRLPNNPEARNYLRWQRFPRAVETVTEVPFRSLVDSAWFAEDATPLQAKSPLTSGHAAITAYLDRVRFFCFEPTGLDDDDDRAPLIEHQWRRWKDPLVIQLLRSRLSPTRAHEVARVVVQELLTNLMNSPANGTVVCVAQIDSNTEAQDSLTIAGWHAPSAEADSTLFHRLFESIDESSYRKRFDIRIGVHEPAPAIHLNTERRVSAENILESLGLSRRKEPPQTPLGPEVRALDPLKRPDPASGTPESVRAEPPPHEQASSFEALYRFVIDEFEGRLDFWSGTNFVSVGSVTDDSYSVDVHFGSRPRDHGTIVAARLPLRDA